MNVLVTGVNGQLGYDVVKILKAFDISCQGVDLADFDLTDKKETLSYVDHYKPDVIIHCAAYTAVDKAEEMRDACYAANVTGTENVAIAAREQNAKIVYVSTDYIFDGTGKKFHETNDPPSPINWYGQTKLEGERVVQSLCNKHFIVRTSWVFGANGTNFIKTMLRLGKERDEISVVADQIGSPTYTADLAVLLHSMIKTERFGVYHATNEGLCSWYDFAKEIMLQSGLVCKVLPSSTEGYPYAAKRPLNSRMSKKSLDENGFDRLPLWKDALKKYLEEIR